MHINEMIPYVNSDKLSRHTARMPTDLHQIMTKHGYKFLGRGVDQTVWTEPDTNQVLKIVGTKNGSVDKRHAMFFMWHQFCEKQPNNPFLPKVYGYFPFEVGDQTYVGYRQEQLTPGNSRGHDYYIVDWMDDFCRLAISKTRNMPMTYAGFTRYLKDHHYGYREDVQIIQNFIQQYGKQNLALLFNTIKKLYIIAKEKGYFMDLTDNNIMSRNGNVVIVDPWFTSFTG